MEIDKFYKLSSKLSSTTFQAAAQNLWKGRRDSLEYGRGIGISATDSLLLGDYGGINFPVIYKHEYGKKLLDVIDTGTVSNFLISDFFLDILRKNRLTGYKIYPIRLTDKKNNEITGYHGLSITGRCGSVDYSKSEIIHKRSPVGKDSVYYLGYHVDLTTWDGTDFFLPTGTFGIITTKKAADILKAAKITNILLNNLATIEVWEEAIPSEFRQEHQS